MPTVRFTESVSKQDLDALFERAKASYGAESCWKTLYLNRLPLGNLSPEWAERIKKDWEAGCSESSDGIFLNADGWPDMGGRLQHLARTWNKAGLLHGWRNECFDLTDGGGNPLFTLERAAFRPFGLLSRAVHLNGLVESNGRWHFWIGRRSPHKAVDPGKLDNIAGGGVSGGEMPSEAVCGEMPSEAVCRESSEEAGLDKTLFPLIRPVSRLHSLRPVSRGVHNEILYVFDAVLPETFLPENQDGEVAGFEKMDIGGLLDAMLSKNMMHDAQLVTLDAFYRYGLIDAAHPLSEWLDGIRL
ncbi:TPA: NUDIX domain-containing protein [Neisseria gonorrhoeae]